jgi:sentrin-specific protease 8
MKIKNIRLYINKTKKKDFDTLKEGQWLNDTIIEFYMEFTERQVVPKDVNYLFLRPGITHLIAFASG